MGAAVASPAKSVRVTSYAEFAEGQAQGVLISSLGDVRPGYSQNRPPLPSLTLDSVRAWPRRQMAQSGWAPGR